MNLMIFATNLAAHELLHFLVFVMVSIIIYLKYKSFKLVLVAFLVSFLIDTDHLFEGFLIYGLNIKRIFFPFHGGFFREAGKMTIFFHSWEILPVVLLVAKKTSHWKLGATIIVAAVGHYLADQTLYSSLYSMSLLEYFFTYRAVNNFDFWKLCGGC